MRSLLFGLSSRDRDVPDKLRHFSVAFRSFFLNLVRYEVQSLEILGLKNPMRITNPATPRKIFSFIALSGLTGWFSTRADTTSRRILSAKASLPPINS